MKRSVAIVVLASLAFACGQKTDQQTAQQPATSTQAPPPARQEPPRPALRQSDARVWIDAVTVAKGASGSFKVHYFGVEPAKAIVVPLTVPTGVTVDSVSYAGSILEYIATRPVRIDNDNQQVLFTAIPTSEPDIPAKEGLLGTVYFTLGANAVTGDIEETFIPPGNYLTYVDTASTLVEPQFEPGKLTVE
jgi:hypothetical protein